MLKIQRFKELRINQIKAIKALLNKYVSFGLATDQLVYDLIKNHRVYVATHNGNLVGVLTVYFHLDHLEIKHIAVSEDLRNRGIGTNLLDLALSDNNTYTIIKAVGWVKPTGWDAESLFLKRGFKLVVDNKDYWRPFCTSRKYCPNYTYKCNCSCKIVELNLHD